MSLLDETKHLLHQYNVRPNKRLGQSFCVDDNLLRRMIAYSNSCNDDVVLEIGSGFGFLTRLLSKVVKQVIAVELDPKLFEALRNGLKDGRNIQIISGNILKITLPKFNKIVANPPYSISSPLIMRLFERSFDCAVLTLQKEFAEKLNAQVGTRNYGPLTIVADYKVYLNILEQLSRDSFYPQPKIESVVVFIKTHIPKFSLRDEKLFFRLVDYLFTQRNRKVKKPLESFFLKEMRISKVEAGLIIKGLPFTEERVSDLKPEEFGALSNEIYPFLHSKIITFENYRFYIFPEVYEPAEDTFLIAECLHGLE
ncbi:MAG: 16S rRNA (adenine(1518)-N(6)/adenine(1519)-N(6))-dimethyltransferase RsmA, partial [Candidatus Bathyarchaeota archaeon]